MISETATHFHTGYRNNIETRESAESFLYFFYEINQTALTAVQNYARASRR
jgi:hypothetical protein